MDRCTLLISPFEPLFQPNSSTSVLFKLASAFLFFRTHIITIPQPSYHNMPPPNSHLSARGARTEVADFLSNTAQVLTSFAEKLSESSTDGLTLHLVKEALRLLQLCLEVQEKQAQESAEHARLAESMMSDQSSGISNEAEQGSVSLAADTPMEVDDGKEPAQDERWASIVEPVTNDTLLDTVLAQLETLSQTCGLILNVSEQTIDWVEGYVKDLISVK